jgi:RHS repeat-associated protein
MDQKDDSGLMYRRNRYYDPATGRFTQEDPIGLAGGLNQYGYANGDPVNFSDPFGLMAIDHDVECPTCGDDMKFGAFPSWMGPGGFRGALPAAMRFGRTLAQTRSLSSAVGAARSAAGAASAAASAASRVSLREGDIMLAVVHEGRILARTADHTLSHGSFVQRSVGNLPKGARVVTIGKYEGQINVLNSRTFHGNQLPAPRDMVDLVRSIYH